MPYLFTILNFRYDWDFPCFTRHSPPKWRDFADYLARFRQTEDLYPAPAKLVTLIRLAFRRTIPFREHRQAARSGILIIIIAILILLTTA